MSAIDGKKTLGVIGGLGPIATVYFMQLCIEMSEADTDQEHIEVLMHSKPSIPDRTGYILGRSEENPLPPMIRIGCELAKMGAEVLAIPCITAHYFHEQLQREIPIPILHAIEDTVSELKKSGVKRAGIMATDGTVQSGLFQKALAAAGMEAVLPDLKHQQGVQELIYGQVKAGKAVDMSLFAEISDELFDRGAEVVLLGCTELSLIKRDHLLGKGYLDVMEVLAREAVKRCGRLKPGYENLITL